MSTVTDLILQTTHQVTTILHNLTSPHVTAQRLSVYKNTLTATAFTTISTPSTSNPAQLLHKLLHMHSSKFKHTVPLPHDCIHYIVSSSSCRPDMSATPAGIFLLMTLAPKLVTWCTSVVTVVTRC